MPDPSAVAIPVLAGAALTQGMTFLYGQAAELLRMRREGNAEQARKLTVPDAFVPLRSDPAPDLTVLDNRARELEALLDVAEIFVGRAADDLDGADLALRTCFGRVRDILEAAYGARLTFVGEPRSELHIRQTVDDIYGTTTGMKVHGAVPTAASEVEQRVGTVHPGGELTGVDIDLGG